MLRPIAAIFVGLSCLAGCDRTIPVAPAEETPHAGLAKVPLEMTVGQRSTTAVPGTDGQLLLTVGDITRDQVMASLTADGGDGVMPGRSMRAGESAAFQFGGTAYRLELRRLDNALVGDDFATFVISATDAAAPADEPRGEAAKIERLLEAIAGLKDATFIRNDGDHTATEAAEHLRRKWQSDRAEVQTARQFIDRIASRSSVSGKPYEIRFPDGRVTSAEAYLRERLDAIEAGR